MCFVHYVVNVNVWRLAAIFNQIKAIVRPSLVLIHCTVMLLILCVGMVYTILASSCLSRAVSLADTPKNCKGFNYSLSSPYHLRRVTYGTYMDALHVRRILSISNTEWCWGKLVPYLTVVMYIFLLNHNWLYTVVSSLCISLPRYHRFIFPCVSLCVCVCVCVRVCESFRECLRTCRNVCKRVCVCSTQLSQMNTLTITYISIPYRCISLLYLIMFCMFLNVHPFICLDLRQIKIT